MIALKINFCEIRNRVQAAETLQEAGQDDDAKLILVKLAEDIKVKLCPTEVKP